MHRRVLPLLVTGAALLCSGALLSGCAVGTPVAAGFPSITGVPTGTLADAAPETVTASPTPARTPSPTPAPTRSAPSAVPATTSAVHFPAGSGPVVVLNPGHNGGNAAHSAEISQQVPAGHGRTKECDTTGTNTDAGYPEHAFNWDVTLRVRAILQQHGVRVVLTRPDDAGVGPCVDARAATGNQPGVSAVVSIHADGAPAGGHGFHVNEASRVPDGATAATMAQSHRLSVALHDALAASSGLVPSTYIGTEGYVRRDDFAGLNLSVPPTTFLELGNMRNAGDATLQTAAGGRARIAAAVAAGVLAYLAGG